MDLEIRNKEKANQIFTRARQTCVARNSYTRLTPLVTLLVASRVYACADGSRQRDSTEGLRYWLTG